MIRWTGNEASGSPMNGGHERSSARGRIPPGVAFELFEGLLLPFADAWYVSLRVVQQRACLAQFVEGLRGGSDNARLSGYERRRVW